MVPKVALAVLSLSPVAPEWAARLEVASVRASSTYPAQEEVSYGAELLVDGRACASWVEGEQEIRFTPKTTDSVRITFDVIVKGKEFDDLCVSEAYFIR